MRPTCAHAHLGRDTPVGSRRRGHDNGCAAGNLGGDGHHERTARQNRRASGHVDADSACAWAMRQWVYGGGVAESVAIMSVVLGDTTVPPHT
eukprot:19933-Chlamydomonas_euryale.AAC.2